jgi:hypothetical protein
MSTPGKYFYAIRRKSDGAIICRGYQTAPPHGIELPDDLEVIPHAIPPEAVALTDEDLTRGTINNGKSVLGP